MPERPQQLDFSSNGHVQAAPMIAVVSHIIKSFGEQGCTTSDVMGIVQKNHVQWKPTSASPAMSNLLVLGCIRVRNEFGVRRYFHERDFDIETDMATLRAREKRMREEGKKREEPKLPPSTPAPRQSAKILFGIGENQTTALTIDEARELYRQLHELFGGK